MIDANATAQENSGSSKLPPLLDFISAALLVVLCVLIFGSTVLRHAGISEPRVFEITRVVFVYLIGFSAIAAFVRWQNIYVPGIWSAESISHQFAMLLISGVLAYFSARYVVFLGWEQDATSLLQLPESALSIPILLFSVALTLLSAMRLVKALNRKRPDA